MIIQTTGLTKAFGTRRAIDDVHLAVPPGICFGFLGPNGAGKTTLIRMLLGLARPTSGSVQVRGADVHHDPTAALGRVGAIVEEPRFYAHLTGRENLEVHAALLRDRRAAVARIPALLERVQMASRADERVKGYSLGMRQRLGGARALLNDPELLVLDEPTNGLDAAGMVEFRQMIRGLVDDEQRTVFLSSHLLDEVERLCDRVAIVDHGRVITEGSLEDLLAEEGGGLEIEVDNVVRAIKLLEAFDGVQSVRETEVGTIIAAGPVNPEHAIAVNRALVEAGIGVSALGVSSVTLEQRYLQITAGSTPEDVATPPEEPA
ncbi:MAG TPA: ABC transporter ATP-binding protein [Solirubrobacteraceae bacterium]